MVFVVIPFVCDECPRPCVPGHVPLGDRSAEEELVYLRGRLKNVTDNMYTLYESLLLGSGPYELKGSLYDSPAHIPLLFDHGCLRLQKEHHAPPCFEFEHDYYYRTMRGLDNLVKHFREECLLLALEPDSSLTVNNTRFNFIWVAGKYDLRGGLKQNTRLFMNQVQGPPRRDRVIQICALLCVLFSQVYFVRYMFLPWTKRTQMESHRISELLAQLPAEIDMHAIVAEMLLKSNGRNEDEDYVDLQDKKV